MVPYGCLLKSILESLSSCAYAVEKWNARVDCGLCECCEVALLEWWVDYSTTRFPLLRCLLFERL